MAASLSIYRKEGCRPATSKPHQNAESVASSQALKRRSARSCRPTRCARARSQDDVDGARLRQSEFLRYTRGNRCDRESAPPIGPRFASLNPAGGRPFGNPGSHAANLVEKGPAKTSPLVLVVPRGYRKFFLGFAEYANPRHLSCCSTSARTSFASRALVSPAS